MNDCVNKRKTEEKHKKEEEARQKARSDQQKKNTCLKIENKRIRQT